ncbi:L,D-transpeptidase [Polaribacter sp. SA4-10]|uniref:L,D-transpeptidase n=1 Tax=Polaribacter sp. SA4-10 TaxID=754397 RepID=UPI000B3C9259|nr:L,D-transpeptidase [Polaribacter sp. SA4-10]ARV07099.1 L,D-transpeptidase [Polaribacter sp. SA4-10]
MKYKVNLGVLIVFFLIVIIGISYSNVFTPLKEKTMIFNTDLRKNIPINSDISVENYFQFLDSIVLKYDSITSYKLTEHLLVRANPWIIDSLKNTDYYTMKEKDSFVYNQKKMVVLKKGATLILPSINSVKKMLTSFENTKIDVNIPEYKLRIFENSKELFNFSVRVGRNEKKYLKMAGRILDLRTKTGKGKIVRHERFPDFYNPVNGYQYYVTKRDDKKVTKLPQIPFIETEINGVRYGQLIHPTTNPVTLGKASSNGCIGTNESAAWVIYYYAPINTKITIRYDLIVNDLGNGNNLILKDIYGYKKKE